MRHWMVLMLLIVNPGAPVSVAAAQAVQEVRVRWDAYLGAPAPQVVPGTEQASNLFTLLERRRVPGSFPRQRNPELSSNHIVVVAVDAHGLEIHRQLIADPRILRVERPGPTGELRGIVLHHAKTELLITLPDDPAITELWLYHPRWTGRTFILDLLGTIALR